MNPFHRQPANDSPDLIDEYRHPERGLHRFFRHTHAAMQRRFVDLAEVEAMPRAFLHGNPHLANYAKTTRGAAMVDFDRARFGPFGYDVSRFLVSVSCRRADESDGRLLHPAVLDSFRRGYLLGVSAPGLGWEEMRDLRKKQPKRWQQDLVRYLEKGRQWGGRLAQHAIDPRQPRLQALLESYLESRGELELASVYSIASAAEVPGSLGKLHTLLLLEPNRDDIDPRLVDVKEVYDEPDDAYFMNPFGHNGQRMVEAGELHAPGWEQNPGWATYDGVEYWVREIPTQNEKLKRRLTTVQQIDVCFAVASQLGRAHSLSMPLDAKAHLGCFEALYDHLIEVAAQLRAEVGAAHLSYLDRSRLKKKASRKQSPHSEAPPPVH